ncbi:MAG TPA: DnaJ C-terminal domain-containing protein, partial [Bryobacteraceae bacterium]|nr:DnaJ C-terminal domain-containing protein [Bryobacteraceae bacterium]
DAYRQVSKKLRVTVPAGIADGNRLRLPNEGQPGANGGPNGDLYIFFSVKEHAFFERDGNDLRCTIPISITQAVLGAQIEVPTLEGPHALLIPEGTQSGAELRITGKGLPEVQGRRRGDLVVKCEVRIPAKLTKDQKRLFEELAQTLPVNNEPHEKGLFAKVKDYFM